MCSGGCNYVCGLCPTMPKWRSLTCPSCRKFIVNAGERCDVCGAVFEPLEEFFCTYNKMICNSPCRLLNRPNESGTQINCRVKKRDKKRKE